MKFKVEYSYEDIEISLNRNGGGIQQLFYGPVYRGLFNIKGHYDHKNKNLWPVEKLSWERRYMDTFIEYCQNGNFLGVYLLWFISRLPIVTPKLESNKSFTYDGKPSVSVMSNLDVDGYFVIVKTSKTEHRVPEEIMNEIIKALESFNIEAVFNEMIAHYKALHLQIEPEKKLLNLFTNPFSKKEKWEKENTFHPCWKNRISGYEQTWSYKEALEVFKNEFEKHRESFYEQLD